MHMMISLISGTLENFYSVFWLFLTTRSEPITILMVTYLEGPVLAVFLPLAR